MREMILIIGMVAGILLLTGAGMLMTLMYRNQKPTRKVVAEQVPLSSFEHDRHSMKVIPSRRIMFMILHTADEVRVRDTMEKTWLSHLDPKYEDHVFVEGGSETIHSFRQDHTLHVPVMDTGREVLFDKTMEAMRWLLTQPEWDLLVRTNNGTYFQPHFIQEWLYRTYPEQKSSLRHLAGGLLEELGSQQNLNGSCMLLSRDTVQAIVKWDDGNKMDSLGHYESYMYSNLITHLGIPLTSVPRVMDWLGTESVTDLPNSAWAYRVSQPYGAEHRIRKFQQLYDFLTSQ